MSTPLSRERQEELARQLLWRDARLRAHRSLGLPVDSAWRGFKESAYSLVPMTDEAPIFWVNVGLSCELCGQNGYGGEDPALPDVVARAEREAIRELEEAGCQHAGPLLREDPPELAALIALELLSGR